MSNQSTGEGGADKYLLFQLGEGLFGTPLVEVREVVEYKAAKPIPHTPPYFKGVINIRGEIIGVIDLRQRLNTQGREKPTALLIFETETGPLAAIVDTVQSVTVIAEKDLERRSLTHGQNKDREYFLGVGKVKDQLLTVISLGKVLSSDQLNEISRPSP